MALVFIWILCVKRIFNGSIYYCALTCGSFVLGRCSAVWRLGAGGFLVVALVVVLVNCIYFRSTFHSEFSW